MASNPDFAVAIDRKREAQPFRTVSGSFDMQPGAGEVAWHQLAHDWVIIDHHVTEANAKNATFIHDLNKSAGRL